MKKLQNNFTTIEQSKRLLEIGIPADSADMYYHLANHQYYVREEFSIKQHDFFEFYKNIFYPCWSVGRLIEIIKICSIPVTTLYIKSDSKQPVLEFLLNDLETSVVERNIDFSRLEE